MDLGAAMLPVAREATAQDISVVPMIQVIPGATESDVATQVKANGCELGEQFGENVTSTGASGSVAIYTGTPGNPFGAEWMPCAEETVEKNGWNVAITGNTNWTPQGTQEAAAAYISKGGTDAMIYDYSPTAFNEKLESSGQKVPTEAIAAAEYAFMKRWLEAKENGKPYEAFLSNSEAQYAYTAASTVVEKALGDGSDIPISLELPQTVVNAEAYEGEYDPSLPEGLSFNSLLPDRILRQLVSE
jgi:hypothetical protein